MKHFHLILVLPLLSVFTGCVHKAARAKVPPPPELPPISTATSAAASASLPKQEPTAPIKKPSPVLVPEKPLCTEVGIASWYGPPYHNRRAANGEIYDMNQMTAAHRTLPLNSLVRVTNIKTGSSAVVRITDRGPFIGERMLDLSLAAAKAVDVWRPGLAWVKMDVLQTPSPIDSGGKWAVQIGAFESVQAATHLKESLVKHFSVADVLEFAGPTGEWVRVRVPNDDRASAEQISRSITTPEGGVFLVRLD